MWFFSMLSAVSGQAARAGHLVKVSDFIAGLPSSFLYFHKAIGITMIKNNIITDSTTIRITSISAGMRKCQLARSHCARSEQIGTFQGIVNRFHGRGIASCSHNNALSGRTLEHHTEFNGLRSSMQSCVFSPSECQTLALIYVVSVILVALKTGVSSVALGTGVSSSMYDSL